MQEYLKPEELLSDKFLNKYKDKQPDWGFDGLGYVVYKRTYARRIEEENRTEEWWETVARCVRGAQKIGAKYTKEEAERLYDLVFNLKCSFSGRGLWQLGTKLSETIADALLNCWVRKVASVDDFVFVFAESMLGGGVGCNISKEYTQELPRVKQGVSCKLKNTKDAEFIVPDSKEGWGELWRRLLEAYLVTGKSFTYSAVCIRSSGEPLKTFGGIAPGPKPLIDGAEELTKILESRAGKKLRTQDVADIICTGGQIVKSGGIRRTALILMGDVDDAAYLNLKRWDLGGIPNYRANSNNSVICNNFSHISDKFWEGYNGNGEPYGLVNLKLAKKVGRLGETEVNGFDLHDDSVIGLNPCQPGFAPMLKNGVGLTQFDNIKEGDNIWSETGWTKVVKKWSTGLKPVFRYRTNAGVFYGTENHRILSNGKKVEVKDAKTIDALHGPDVNVKMIDSLNPQDILDGLVIGDGSRHMTSKDKVYLTIGEKDHDYFKSEISKLLLGPHAVKHETAQKVKTTIREDEVNLLPERVIPDRFVYSQPFTAAAFLRGLYSANGSVIKGKRVALKTTSYKLAEQVQLMLSYLGIKSCMTTNKESKIKWNNGTYTSEQSFDVNIGVDVAAFANKIGFIQGYKIKDLNDLVKSKKSNGKTKKTYEVTSCDYVGDFEVFDMTVDNAPHTYWTGGLNVSNCAEATLGDSESCNLSELFLNRITSKEEMLECSILLYKTQKAIAAHNYLFPETNEIVHRNMRLGLGVTGVCQKVNSIKEWCDFTYTHLRKFDKKWSKENSWPESIRLTVVKPSGSLSLLPGSTPGVHPGFSRFFTRRVRFSTNDSLVEKLREAGYEIEPEVQFDGSLNHDISVISFPCKFEGETLVASQTNAIAQLELVKTLQTHWADQAVSVTCYYKKEEIPAIKKWLSDNYNSSVKSVSFLLHQEHGFKQPVLEEMTEEDYVKKIKLLKSINFKTDNSIEMIDIAGCETGACPIR